MLFRSALDEPQHHRLLVLGPAGLPAGTIERPEIGEAVIRKIGLRLPPQILAAARQFNGYPLGLALPQVTRGMIASGEINTTQIQPGQVSQAR